MGGKQKQAQRTKGNVKPSSSARAAELLTGGSSGTPSLGFVGFGSSPGDLGYVPAASGGDDIDNSIDADFRMVLRKLYKRDATTKLKALQELAGLCKEKDLDSVKSVLPFWPRIYNKVAIDHDRRVREASQQAFEQLILRVRRNIAPHLRALMGTWVVSQADLYAPAASAATSAFLCAFPPSKQTEALVFCKEETLQHLYENLLVHTAQTLSDAKTTEPEDMEAKFHRVVCASLTALKNFLGTVPIVDQSPLVDKYRTMLSDNKFWKLAKHKQPMIMGAFYSVLSAFCQHHPSVVADYSDKMSPVVLHNLDVTEPLVCGTLWEAALYAVSTLQDCWKHVNPRKGVLPKLWSVLKQGGNGSAGVIFPNILPFLNHLPSEVIGEGTGFYQEFFTNMKLGLMQEKVAVSPSECSAIVRAFMECLHYSLSRNLDNTRLVDCLITDHLMLLLGSAILEDNPPLTNTPFFSKLVDLVTYLHKVSVGDDVTKAEMARSAINQITGSVKESKYLESEQVKVSERYATFLESFKHQMAPQVNKGPKVKFADDTKASAKPEFDQVLDFDATLVEPNGPIFPLICDSCKEAFDRSLSDKSISNLAFFGHIFKAFSSEYLVTAVWGKSNSQALLSEVIKPWITNFESVRGKEKSKVSGSFVDILGSLYQLCSAEKKTNFLSSALEVIPDMAIFQQFAQVAYRHNADKPVRAWFKGPEFGQKMVAVTRDLCDHSIGSHGNASAGDGEDAEADQRAASESGKELATQWELLSLAFTVDEDLEPLLGESYVSEVLCQILRTLPPPGELAGMSQDQIHRCVAFVCDVANNFFSNLKGCLLLPPAEELLFALFQMSCQQILKSEVLAEKVESTWQHGVRALVTQRGGFLNEGGFLQKASSHIRHTVVHDVETLDRLQSMVRISLSLARCVGSCLVGDGDVNPLTSTSAQALLQELFLRFTHASLPQWESSTMVFRELTLSVTGDAIRDAKVPTKLPKCVAFMAFTSQLLSSMLKDSVAKETGATTTGAEASEVVVPEVDVDLVSDLWCAVAFCRASGSPQTKGQTLSDFGRAQDLLETDMRVIYELLPKAVSDSVLERVFKKSMELGGLWALASKAALKTTNKKHIRDLLESDGGLDRFEELTEPTLHTLQVSLDQLSLNSLRQLVEVHTALLMTSDPDRLSCISGSRGHVSVLSRYLGLQEPVLTQAADPESCGFDAGILLNVLEHIRALRQEHDDNFLFDSHVKSQPWEVVSFNAEIIFCLQQFVAKLSSKLSDKAWDFILCSLVAWIQSCNESKSDLTTDLKTQTFAVATFDLLSEVARCISVQDSPGFLPGNLQTEWREFFSEAAYSLLLPMFVDLAAQSDTRDAGVGHDAVVCSLAAALAFCPVDHIKKHDLHAKLVADDTSNLPDGHQTALNHLCPLLLSKNRAVQLGSYRLLLSLLPDLLQFDEADDAEDKVEDRVTRSPPLALMAVLDAAFEGVKLLLEDVSMEEPITIDTHGDEYMCTMGYLLSWKLVLGFVKEAKVELRAEYAHFLRNTGRVSALIPCLMKLMPITPLIQLTDALTSRNQGNKLSTTGSMFAAGPLLDMKGGSSSEEVHHVACSVYYETVQDLPAVLRQWYNDQDKRVSSLVNRYTSKHVSPLLCAEEIHAIQKSDCVLDNMVVKTRPAAREVVATYSLDEITIELVVTLPSNHPLGPMTVDCGKRIGVANTQWRNWMLQLTTFLHKQNGTILDGLTLWKRNVDKRFEGVDECMICFSVIHGSNFHVPKLQCKTCKKRYHSACLYKWFNTSNNSTCPLCRNLF